MMHSLLISSLGSRDRQEAPTRSQAPLLAIRKPASVSGTLSVASSLVLGGIGLKAPASANPYSLLLPSAGPGFPNSYFNVNPGGTVSWSRLPVVAFYTGASSATGLICYTSTAVTSGGTATFFPTTTGASGGTSIFPTAILSATATASASTANANSVPLTSIKTLSTVQVVVNVVTASSSFAANGTTVYCTLVGY